MTNTDVAIAVSNARVGKIPKERAVGVVVGALNQSIIKPEIGSTYIEEFGFFLVLKPDGTWLAEKRRKNEKTQNI